ncbi:DUF5615 family PIN-like protein [Candidatus Poriferisodalis sp.]|uniref:DUF5615 family PIN-like protein n=1 Tax=Candidatus Poriferisodalis sp. TaxID=3101277 RepID=UPI003D0F1E87
MRLLLDEMHAPAVAAELRLLGHDVVAVKARSELAGLPDAELFIAATTDGRAMVTENVKDFAALHKSKIAAGQGHPGVIFTSSRRFPRGAGDHVPELVDALAKFLTEHAVAFEESESFVWWLERVEP